MIRAAFANMFASANLKAGFVVFVFWASIAVIVDLQQVPGHLILRDPLASATFLFEQRLRDPANTSIGCCAPWLGWASNVTSVLWFATAGIGLVGILVLAGIAAPAASTRLMAAGFAMSVLLGGDDLFMLHEAVLPALGIQEGTTYAIYLLMFAAFLALAWPFRMHLRAPFLAVAFLFLGLSVFIDVILQRKQYWEDIFKLAGVTYWLAFHALLLRDTVTSLRRTNEGRL